jgi:hypothetical protein
MVPARGAILLLLAALVLAASVFSCHNLVPPLSGEVRGPAGPLAGARVRVKGATGEPVRTDYLGHFRLAGPIGQTARVTAGSEGYVIAGLPANQTPLLLSLHPLPAEDCERYSWVGSEPDSTRPGNCGNCHAEIFREWSASGHARAATNHRFRSLYDGSDWQGQRTVGWNLLAEHPDGAGVCTACHAPTVSFGDPAYYDLRQVRGTAAQGVHCDYCHKVASVVNDQIGLTHGRFGLNLLRPAQGQLFFGPLDDIDRGEDAYSALYKDSKYCASCHEGTVFGVPVYTTYSEWLASPARQEGKQCQTCHMAPSGTLTNLAPGKSGIPRDPQTLGNHRFFAGSQADMLRRSLHLSAVMHPDKRSVRVEVTLRAENVGHRLPTGFADRQLLLLVEACDQRGRPLSPQAGTPLLPDKAGSPLVGVAGRLYAKQLNDFEGHGPVPFWRAQPDVVDTRLSPNREERTTCYFPENASHLRVRLLYRRFWAEVERLKGWPASDLLVTELNLTTPGVQKSA